MGMIASYKMVDPKIIDHLLQLDEEYFLEELSDINQEAKYKTIDIDTSWDGLHFLLTGKSAVVPMKDNKLSAAIVGSHLFSEDDDKDFITYTRFEELEEIFAALKMLNKKSLLKNFTPALFSQSRIYPDIWASRNKEELFRFLYETGYKTLVQFYRDAIKKKKSVIISIN